LDDAPEQKHEIASFHISDTLGSRLVKAIVHRAPSADPYDVVTVEGAKPSIKIVDLDLDGRPELFVDTVVGAHCHQANIFCLNHLNRFQEAQGSPLFADWGPVQLAQADGSSKYRITILRGAGAAGRNAEPLTYMLTDGRLELLGGAGETSPSSA